MEQSPMESFNQGNSVRVVDRKRISNLVNNVRFGQVYMAPELNDCRIVFTSTRKGKPDFFMTYLINGADLTPEQITLLQTASLIEKK